MKITASGPAYYHHDGLGSTVALTGENGELLESYRYDAFGGVSVYDSSGSALPASPRENRFLFTGREWLAEVGLYDYRNRVYSAHLGRFLQTDPIRFSAGDVNIYRYCGNNAVNLVDPWGLCSDDDLDVFEAIKKFVEELFKALSKSGPIFDVLDFTSAGGKIGVVAEQISKRTDLMDELIQNNPNENNLDQIDKKQKDFGNASEIAQKVTKINFDPFDKESYK